MERCLATRFRFDQPTDCARSQFQVCGRWSQGARIHRCALLAPAGAGRAAREDVLLALLAAEAALHVDGTARVGVEARVVHRRRGGEGRGREDLDLFRVQLEVLRREALELAHVRFGAAGVGRDEVVREELLASEPPRDVVELLLELQERLHAGLAHRGEHVVDDVLGGELELSRDVVLRERGDIFAAVSRVGGDEIRADARGDEDVADAGEVAEFTKKSLNYRNLWRKDTGFFHPKDKDGKWIEPFDYTYAGGQGARDYYDENNAWTYIWDVQHAIPDLIDLFGGADKARAKMDRMFNTGYGRARWHFYDVLPDSTGNMGMFTMGNDA